MRTEAPEAQQSVSIPADLAAFLTGVHQQVLDSDEATIHECDDCLQSESAYGGLLEEGGSVFGFTYFPGEGIGTRWELLLDRAEIAAVAGGQQRELWLWACQMPGCGNKSSNPDEVCSEHDHGD